MKVYYHQNNGVIVELRSETPPAAPYIERDRALPIPVQAGHIPKLAADFGNDEVWYELIETLEGAKQRKIAEIVAYDKSSAVDEFLINGVGMWLDRDTRASLFASITAEEAIGRETTVLWTQTEPPFPIELPIIPFRGLLKQLEVYAKDCFNTTAKHIAAVFALTSIEDVNDYDFTTGYPEKLSIGL